VLEDPAASGLGEAEKELFVFVDKVNSDSPNIAAADIEALHRAGWTDEALYQAISVCALFNFYNRWVDASGVHPLDPQTHRSHAKRTAKAGYIRTPAPSEPPA
jgi:alkylhydroperoxidase family enzyme